MTDMNTQAKRAYNKPLVSRATQQPEGKNYNVAEGGNGRSTTGPS